MFVATTRVSVLRSPAGDLDDLDGPVGDPVVVVAGLPAHVSTTSRQHFEPGAGRSVTVETLTARIQWPGGSIDPATDTLRDDRTGETITVDLVQPTRYGGLSGDIVTTTRNVY
jgi:hypothetical protein